MSVWKRQEWDDGKNMKEWWSHCIMSQSFTQILCTVSSDLIAVKVECSECLYKRDRNEMMVKNMKEWWSHCFVSQCFTQILCTVSSDLIAVKVECSDCLYERDRNEVMVKTWRSDDLTVLCRNASPKYCAPWSPIWLSLRPSVVSVCMKETGMSWW